MKASVAAGGVGRAVVVMVAKDRPTLAVAMAVAEVALAMTIAIAASERCFTPGALGAITIRPHLLFLRPWEWGMGASF